jgi:hypothetical protein
MTCRPPVTVINILVLRASPNMLNEGCQGYERLGVRCISGFNVITA